MKALRRWARRLPADWPWILGAVLFPLLLLWRPLVGGEVLFWGTPLLQFVPWQRAAAEMWRAGQLPLWNPLVGCGAPLAANYQTAAFYPPNLLMLLVPAELALGWIAALHVALAGFGMLRLGRAWGLTPFASFVGALAAMGSGYLVSRVGLFPSMVAAFPWPIIWLWRVEALVARPGAPAMVGLGLALGVGLLAGHAQTAFYGLVLMFAYLGLRLVQTIRTGCAWRPALRLCVLAAGACGVGLGLAAVQLLPTAELLLQSQRGGGLDEEFALTYSLWPWRLITLAAPDFFGNPGRDAYWGYANYWEGAAHVGILPLLLALRAAWSKGTGRPQGRAERGWRVFWVGCVGASLFLALGRFVPIYPLLFRVVPGMDLFQAPARWLLIATLALASLAALGAQALPGGLKAQRMGGLWCTLGLALLLGGALGPRVVPAIRASFARATVWLGLGLAAAGGLMLVRAWLERRRRPPAWALRGWEIGVAAFVAADLLGTAWPLVPSTQRLLYEGQSELARMLQAEEGAGPYSGPVRTYWPTDPTHRNRDYDAEYRVKFSVFTPERFERHAPEEWRQVREVLLPNAGMFDGIASANNYDPLLVGRYAQLLELAVTSPAVLRVMGVTHVISDWPWPAAGSPSWSGGRASLYRLPERLGRAWVVPRARMGSPHEQLARLADPSFDPRVEVLLETGAGEGLRSPGAQQEGDLDVVLAEIVLRDTPNGVTIRAVLDRPGYLVVADTWYPGWHATLDGRAVPLLRANYAFRALWLEAGEHVVEMVYRPASLRWGAAFSLATVVGIGVASLFLAWRRRWQAHHPRRTEP